MIGKDLSKITQADLQSLIDNVVLEGKTIEYKAALPGGTPDEKKEFLKDISSFANASGGDIIYGITEDQITREPKALEGLDIPSVDQEKTTLDNMIRDGVNPRMPVVHIQPIPLDNGKTAIVIRVGRSWVSPHRVTYKGHDKFYSRNSSGAYPLDVGELRTAFTLSGTITERIRRFREERIASLYANETPVKMKEGPKIVLHLLPIASFMGQPVTYATTHQMRPMNSTGWNPRYTLEGFLNYCSLWNDAATTYSYVHLYRNGIIESVEGSLIIPDYGNNPGAKYIDSSYEHSILQVIPNYLQNMKEMSIPTPVFVFLTLIDVKGRTMMKYNSRMMLNDESNVIDRNILVLPEISIDDYDIEATQLMKPIFNAAWNACGYSRSFNYNDRGDWAGGKIQPQ